VAEAGWYFKTLASQEPGQDSVLGKISFNLWKERDSWRLGPIDNLKKFYNLCSLDIFWFPLSPWVQKAQIQTDWTLFDFTLCRNFTLIFWWFQLPPMGVSTKTFPLPLICYPSSELIMDFAGEWGTNNLFCWFVWRAHTLIRIILYVDVTWG